MPDVGDSQEVTLEVNPHDITTAVVLTVIDPDGTVTTPGVIKEGGGATWRAMVTYDKPGTWVLKWVVTGTGAGSETTQVAVGPTPPATRRTYATTADYAEYLGVVPPAGVDLLLARATRLIDQAIMSAVYDVDDDGMPTDSAVRSALRDAVVEQAAYWVQTGEDGVGATGEYAKVAIGSVSLERPQAGAGGPGSGAARSLAPQAWMILQQAGLTGHGPWMC